MTQTLFQLVPASYVLFLREGMILLQLRQNTGFMDGHWACAAAGHVEAGESAGATALREAREEVGLRIPPGALLPLCTLHRSNGRESVRGQRVDFFFQATEWEGTERIVETEKCADLRWFDLQSLPDPMPEHERFVLEHLRAGTLPPIAWRGF